MEKDNITVIIKCAGCGLSRSLQRSKVIECELYLCGIGVCDKNPEYVLPEKKLLKTAIIFAAAGNLYGVQYLMPSKMDRQFDENKTKVDALSSAEKKQNSKLN
jgi:hypothetical protein